VKIAPMGFVRTGVVLAHVPTYEQDTGNDQQGVYQQKWNHQTQEDSIGYIIVGLKIESRKYVYT
jgi:hypothetical protein